MTRILKNCLIFFLMLLPIAAFADISNLQIFTAPANDFSLNLLERTFGSVGNVLHGQGNEILGNILGVFNGLWVVVIGLGILFIVWDSVITAAQNGEMMQTRGKKTVFTILRIVIGICLVVPSKTTGYSLVQHGVIWVVVQGVGLADQITQKLYDYLQAGGQSFTTQPSNENDIALLMPAAADVLKSEICMYKLQDIVDKRNKDRKDALKAAGENDTTAGDELASIGYGMTTIGTDSGIISFGSKNPKYNPDNPGSSQYLAECGTVKWQLNVVLQLDTPEEAASTKKTLAGYMQASLTQMVLNLQPVARELASADVSSSGDPALLQSIAQRAATAMAGSGTSYATLVDPIKTAASVADEQQLKDTLAALNSKGWMFTPMMVIAPGVFGIKSVSLSNFLPLTFPADIANSTVGVLKELSTAEKQQIIDPMAKVNSDDYTAKALGYLKLMNTNNTWPKVDFTSIYKGTADGSYAGDFMDDFDFLFSGTKGVMLAGATSADSMLWVPKGMLIGVQAMTGWVGGDYSDGLDDAIKALDQAQASIWDGVYSGIKSIDDLVGEVKDSKDMAEKGGMTSQLTAMANQVGPLGPLFVTIMTAMIGKSMDTLETNLFNPKLNAMTSSIKTGGEMMVSAMESTFEAGHILFVATLVQKGIEGLSAAVGAIPVVGDVAGGIINLGNNLVHKGIESLTTFHIALAMMLFTGGLLLYIVVPLTFVVAFAAICLRWIGMVVINVLAAPIFCFNLIRSDGEGMLGRGERFLVDLAKTALTPAILVMGAVAFLIMFNIGYIIITSILTQFIPVLAKAYNAAILVPVSLAIILMVFATLMVYISQTLATLCTTELVNHVAGTIGESIQHLQDQSPANEIRNVANTGGQHASHSIKTLNTGGTGMSASPTSKD